MTWTTIPPEPEEPVWTVSEESVADQDFDDLQLTRMGIDIPEISHEWIDTPNPTTRPIVRDTTTPEQLRQLLDVWTIGTIDHEFDEDFLQRFMGNMSGENNGQLTFVEPDVDGVVHVPIMERSDVDPPTDETDEY